MARFHRLLPHQLRADLAAAHYWLSAPPFFDYPAERKKGALVTPEKALAKAWIIA